MFLIMILAMASTAFAQPGDNPDQLYPNTASFGVKVDRSAAWFQQCLRVEHVVAPPMPAKPASCAAYDYYLKLGQAQTSNAEWAGVRACAAAAQDDAVLAMLHANGQGVPRDLDLATHYACRAGGASAELSERVMHLQALKTSAPATHYDQCDDATSGHMGTVCASIRDTQAEKVRNAFFARLRRQLPANQQLALDQLVATTRAFASAREGETSMQGTAAPSLALRAGAREKEWLREHLAALEQGKFALAQPAALSDEDAELNRLYRLLMTAPGKNPDWPDRLGDLTVQKQDVRASQRRWLSCREAWVRFAALRYPAVPADTIRTEFTVWRLHQLRELSIEAQLQTRQQSVKLAPT